MWNDLYMPELVASPQQVGVALSAPPALVMTIHSFSQRFELDLELKPQHQS